jgi:NTP pyrophosphatase (non-canonical NTP hydrolase)
MDIAKLQHWAQENFGTALEHLPLDYGVARLLIQAGQLGEAALQKRADVDKEMADVLFVLLSLANRCGVDLAAAAKQLSERTPAEIVARLSPDR